MSFDSEPDSTGHRKDDSSQSTRPWLIALIVFLLSTLSSEAVVLAFGDGTGNTTAPVDDPGFANVGNRGVYLGDFSGNHWVLTASHVGAGSISLNGSTFNAIGGTETRIKNPTGMSLSEFTDLLMFQIDADPLLPNLTISTTTPGIGSTVTIIGDGLDRESEETTWKVDTSVNPFTWEEGGTPSNATGYKSLGTRTMRWGENVLIDPGANDIVNAGFGDSKSLNLSFDAPGIANEATLANGDSGGGLFYKNGSDWELAGILQATGTFSGQPSNTSVFGNLAFSADLAFYRDEILSVTAVPEPKLIGFVGGFGCLLFCVYRQARRA